MKNHNFLIPSADTDSICMCKSDFTQFTDEEKINLLNEINNILPEKIKLSDDGYFPKFLAIKSKNYVMVDEKGKIKYKGSSIKDQKKEPKMREFMNKLIDSILEYGIDYDKLNDIYKQYIIESNDIKHISEWCTKRVYTKAIMNNERTNEAKVREALKEEEMTEGNRFYLYFVKGDDPYNKKDGDLRLDKYWVKGTENPVRLMQRIYDTLAIFKEILDMNKFIKYHLKTKKEDLNKLLNKE